MGHLNVEITRNLILIIFRNKFKFVNRAMVQPNDVLDQLQQDHFVPDRYIAVYFGVSKYDGVSQIFHKGEEHEVARQTYPDYPHAQQDCALMMDSLQQFGILGKDAKIFDLSQNPTQEEFQEADEEIQQMLLDGKNAKPMIKYMVIWFFAGQGILRDGRQCLLFNEFDKTGKFYKVLHAETKVRDFAITMPNSYHLGLFACTSHEVAPDRGNDFVAGEVAGGVDTNEEEKVEADDEEKKEAHRRNNKRSTRFDPINIFGNIVNIAPLQSQVPVPSTKANVSPANKPTELNKSEEIRDKEAGSSSSSRDFGKLKKRVSVQDVDEKEEKNGAKDKECKEEEQDELEDMLKSAVPSVRPYRPSLSASVVAPRRKVAFRQVNGFREVPDGRALYELGGKLGEGGYGTVYEATRKGSDEVCAVKVMNKEYLQGKQDNGLKYAKREIEALEKMSHPNIVRVLDLCEDKEDIFITMELVAGGNLLQLLQDRYAQGNPLTELEAANIVRQILHALNHIHHNKMVHRDLKPDNVLIEIEQNEDGSEEITCKLTDFGMAFEISQTVENTEQAGTPRFMAPEVIKGKPQTTAIDIWSLGVMTFIMLTNSPPFRGKNRELIFESIKNRPLDFNRKGVKESLAALHDAGELAKDFLSRCMEKDHPEKRPTATELLQHEWVKLGAKDYDVDDVQRLNMGLDLYTARRNTSFQNCVMSFLIEVRSTKEDLKVLGDMFNSMDQNGDGYLSPQEIEDSMFNSQNELKNILGKVPDWHMLVKSISTNNEGRINFNEFIGAASDRLHFLKAEENLQMAFNHLDKNGDGHIDREEVRQALEQTKTQQSDVYTGENSENFWSELFQEIDKDKNGVIDYEEFRDHMLEMIKKGDYDRRSALAGADTDAEKETDLDQELLGNEDHPDEESDGYEAVYSQDTAAENRTNLVLLLYDKDVDDDSDGEDELTDDREIGGMAWKDLKAEAMGQDYQEKNWFSSLKEEDTELLERLREAQDAQGDMEALLVQSKDNRSAEEECENELAQDVIDLLKDKFDRSTLSLTVPNIFEHLTRASNNYELVTSPFVQPVRLNFEHKIVRKAVAIIFVNERIESQYENYSEERKQQVQAKYYQKEVSGLSSAQLDVKFSQSVIYAGAKEYGEDARKLFENVLKFNWVDVQTNLSKNSIISKLKELQKFATDFRRNNPDQDCAIAIVWIGNSLDGDHNSHKQLLQELETSHNYVPPQMVDEAAAQAGSSHPLKYALTVTGEPLCIQEYAEQIAGTSLNTHVITYDQIQQQSSQQLDSYHIDDQSSFHDLPPTTDRSGRSRHIAIHSGSISTLYEFFKEQRERYNRHVFQFPYHLDQTGAKVTDWGEDFEQDQIIFDLRDKINKMLMKQNKPIQTIKIETEVFEERPQLICCEQVDEPVNWNPSVHQLADQILFVGASTTETEDQNIAAFTFRTANEPYKRLQRVFHQMEHYHAATVITDLRSKEDKGAENSFVAIMFTSDLSENPFKFISFKRLNPRYTWESEEVNVEKTFKNFTCVRGCYMLEGNVVFVATMHYMVFFNKELKETCRFSLSDSIRSADGSDISHMTACAPSLLKKDFLFVCSVELVNNDEVQHWILKGGLNVKGRKVTCIMADKLLQTNETINYVMEYAPNKFVAHALPASILVVYKQKVIRRIDDPNLKNSEKNLLMLIPDFNEEKFPFILSTGNETLNLVNLHTSKTQALVKWPIYGIGPQQTVLFEKEDYGFSLLFASRKSKQGDLEFCWHKMEIKRDLIRLLREYRLLPYSEPEEQLKVISELTKQTKEQETKLTAYEQMFKDQAKRIADLEKMLLFKSSAIDQMEGELSNYRTSVLEQGIIKEEEKRDELRAEGTLPNHSMPPGHSSAAVDEIDRSRSEKSNRSKEQEEFKDLDQRVAKSSSYPTPALNRGLKAGVAFGKKMEKK